MSGNLIIGSSHALGFCRAIGSYSATPDEAKDNLIPVQAHSGAETRMLFTQPNPPFLRFEKTGDQVQAKFGPPIDAIRTYDGAKSKVVLMLGGNEPAIQFFYRNPKPFDFFHPAMPQTDPTRQILPLAHMRAIMAELLRVPARATEALANELPKARKYYVAPPPPIPSEDHVRKFPEIFEFDKYGVEDALVRLKLHRLQLDYMMAFCARVGLEFVAPPPANLDERGFLREEYWAGCTHASVDYYQDVVKALAL